jgi:vitamin B12 transporter
MRTPCALIILLSAGANAGPKVEEMIVRAARTPIAPTSTSIPVEVIDAETIEQRQTLFPGELLRGSPGISVSQSGGVGSVTEVRMRGGEANHLLVTIDGIEVNDPALGSNVDFAHLALTGTRHIEVIRGPQSALWGADAIAGMIAFETTPAPGTVDRRIGYEGGSNDTHRVGAQFSDSTRPWYYAVSADHYQTDGTNVAEQGNEDDGYENTTVHLNTGYRADRWRAATVLRYTDATSEYDPLNGPGFTPSDGDLELEVEQRFARAAFEFDVSERWQQRLSAFYFDSKNDNRERGAVSNSFEGDKMHVSYQNDWLFSPGDTQQRVSLAVEYEEENYRQRGAATIFGDPNFDESVDSISGIIEWALAWSDRLSLTLSGRADDNSEFDDAQSIRLGVRYRLNDAGTTLFASAGTGTKNPTFVERFGFTPDTFFGNPDLKPEESTSYSLTLSQAFSWGEASVTGFTDRLKDEINGFVFDPDLGGFTSVNQDGKSHRDGIETTISVTPHEQWRIRADYTYLDATEPGPPREAELRRPDHTGRLVIDYTPFAGRLNLQVGAVYVGDRDDLDFATFPATRRNLGDYTLLHLTSRFQLTERIALRGRVENATDEDYQDVWGFATAGRRFYVGVSVDL